MGGRGGGPSPSALGQAQKKAAAAQSAAGTNALADADIREAYQNAADAIGKGDMPSGQIGGPWVNMLRLRAALSQLGWGREKQDRELMRFIRERKAFAAGEANRKAMTRQHIDAQLLRGGDTIDKISMKDWRPR